MFGLCNEFDPVGFKGVEDRENGAEFWVRSVLLNCLDHADSDTSFSRELALRHPRQGTTCNEKTV
jgi:hypothetical protein